MNTDFLGLILTDKSETTMSFLDWRTLMNGTESNSNMRLIDKAIKELSELAGGKADGFSFDPETGILQLTSGGEAIDDASVTIDLKNYYTKEEVDEALDKAKEDFANNDALKNYYTKEEVDEKLDDVDVDLTGYATEQYVDNKDKILSGEIDTLSKTVGTLQGDINSIDKSPRLTYDVEYNDTENPDVGENAFVLYEIENEGEENEIKEVKKKFTIAGGGGGNVTGNTLRISYITPTPFVLTTDDKAIIEYNFTGIDSSGDPIDGNAIWKINGRIIAENDIVINGKNTFDITKYLSDGIQKVSLSVSDEAGNVVAKTWTVQKIEFKLNADSFDDKTTWSVNPVPFRYIPFGAISKDVHFILDGEEIDIINTSLTGIPVGFDVPISEHGSHLLEVYMTATINGNNIESNHIIKDILWIEESNTTPIIGTAYQNFTARQHDATNIEYTVYDPATITPTVEIAVDGEVVDIRKLEKPTDEYLFKTGIVGEHIITITCGETIKTLKANITKLDIDVAPVTAGLAFDFNPIGYSNNSSDRLWSHNDVTMTVSDNFDWVNGGYQVDENGDQYFCVKAGTNATINYNLFADDPKKDGKEFKIIFKTKNIKKRDTSFLSCMDAGIGLDMKVEHAIIHNSSGSLKTHYCEDEIIEYEFNINKNTDMMIVMSYEDGTPNIPYEYTDNSSFKQIDAKPIVIGSENCDVLIYRMKAYSVSLSDTDIKNNFIADARNADEMIARYDRNQIYNDNGKLISTSENGDFSVENLMKAAPDLRYIFLEVPQFTNDKDNKIDNCTVHFRYPAGKRPQDNWTCTGMRHRGQGTSSNLYGYAGRNIDLCMDRSTSKFTWADVDGDGNPVTVESPTITLTDTSIPTDYLNIKVNIASSENANNAQLARRFNEYQPFLRYARKKDSRVKDTMEFYNCVVFIRETSTDTSNTPHREFNDTDWHFYAIGNVGDSKKTDDTRVNNASDPKEHIIEITDADKPLSAFPTGKESNAICPVGEWCEGNTAYDILHSTEYVYDEEGAFEKFGGETYEFRYEMDGITEEQREININTWRDLYKFIVTSTDEEFYANLENYFVVKSALYYYLFTERYTMVDNRAKNSFWHYGKVYISTTEATQLGEKEASYYIIDDEAAAINDGYRYDLTFGYDMDTALGIDNTGDYVFSYGKEDTDYYIDGDPTSDYVFRVADSVFFCRLRDLFPAELQSMFKDREEKNAWNSASLIDQWDSAQAQFPEELWRLDYERKYYRTYLGLSIDNSINTGEGRGIDKSFLIGKFFGRKKYARRAFEINQEIYFATKYFGNKILSDVFWIRGNVPIGSAIKPNYSLTLTPYSDMYICVTYSSTGEPIHSEENGRPKRIKAGESYTFENNSERMDFIYVYAASWIQEVGDLSRCYIGDNNFSSATRLQRLTVGSIDEGYENTFMEEILVANNPLLEYLDLRNVSGINTEINVESCGNLKELYAEGTNATGVIFANGGLLETAHLPSIKSLTMKNLRGIQEFVVESYDNLQTLVVENTPNINTYHIINNSPLLRTVRLIDLNWDSSYNIPDGSIFNRLLTIGGIDSSKIETDISVLTGDAHIGIIGRKDLEIYREAWSDLTITSDEEIPQWKVTFVNGNTVLDTQYVTHNQAALDPVESGKIAVPTKESTQSEIFTYIGWVQDFSNVVSDLTVEAAFGKTDREYNVKWLVNGSCVYETTVAYGNEAIYEGYTPTKGNPELTGVYYLFDGWDKSTGFIDKDIVVNARFTQCTSMESINKKLEDMTPTDLSALIGDRVLSSNGITTDIKPFQSGDEIDLIMGRDYDFDNVESTEFISIEEPRVFDGTNYIDTGVKLFSEDKPFTLVIDFKYSAQEADGVLAGCYESNAGFTLQYSSNPVIKWGASSNIQVANNLNREIVVVRKKAGDNNLYVYASNKMSDTIIKGVINRTNATESDATLNFGALVNPDGYIEKYAKGTIYWAKLWEADLGESNCCKLASWTRETITMQAAGTAEHAFRLFKNSNTNSFVNCSFLMKNLLDQTRAMRADDVNSGGWKDTNMRTWCNTRVYDGLPEQWKLLIQQVQVKSTIGDQSSEIVTTDDYIWIPSCEEVGVFSYEPYSSEGDGTINYFTSNESRIKKLSNGDGTIFHWWLRSPDVVYPIGFCVVYNTGVVQANSNKSSNNHGVCFGFCI